MRAPAGFNLLIHILEAVPGPTRPERMCVILLFRPEFTLATVHDDVGGMTIHFQEGVALTRSLALAGRSRNFYEPRLWAF